MANSQIPWHFFPLIDQADTWPQKLSKAFNNKCALTFMLNAV